MSKLVKEIAGLCYEVNKLYYDEEDKKIRKEYKERFDKLLLLLEKAITSQFNENDKEYKNIIKKIKRANKKIKKIKVGLRKTVEIFVVLTDVIENIDTLLTSSAVFK
jgi:molecular chaperone DnaK (HSP70)